MTRNLIGTNSLFDKDKIKNLPNDTKKELSKKQNTLKAGKNIILKEISEDVTEINIRSTLPGEGDMSSSVYDPEGGEKQVAFKENLDIAISNISGSIELVNTDISGIKETLSLKGHFRGYIASTDKILEIQNPETGDYLYNAETGTKWLYNSEGIWEDTQEIVPDKITPLSDDIPYISGIASAGVSNEASRSDHVHPSDPTKEDKTALGDMAYKSASNYVDTSGDQNIAGTKNFTGILQQSGENVVTSSAITNIVYATALPANPDENTLYLIKEK